MEAAVLALTLVAGAVLWQHRAKEGEAAGGTAGPTAAAGGSPATTASTRTLRSTRARSGSKGQQAAGHHGSLGGTARAWQLIGRGPGRELTPARRRKTLVLDLDETLIHSSTMGTPLVYDTRIEVMIESSSCMFYVARRPHADYFLRQASQWYDLVIFTASMAQYAEPVIDWLDPRGLIKRRYFRESCTQRDGNFLKNLSIIESDLSQVCIIDNSPIVYSIVPDNAIPIKDWFDDRSDEVLLDLLPFLDALSYCDDVRSVLSLRNT